MITRIPKSSTVKYNLVVLTPDNYSRDKKYPLVVFLHGIGAKGENMDALEREIPPNLKLWTGLGFIIIAVQTPDTFNDEVLFARQYGLDNYPINNKYLTGLSYGAGGTWNFVAASLEQAKMFDAIAPIATTWTPGTWKNIADANLPVWAFHNLFDDNAGTPPDATRAMVTEVNKYKPGLAVMTLFKAYVHGGWGEAYDPVNPPVAPGGEGFVDARITLPQWFLKNSATVRVPVSNALIVSTPSPAPVPTTLTADFNLSDGQVITTTTFDMDASNSTGVKDGWDGYKWDIRPLNVTNSKQYGVRADGAYGGPKKKLIDIVDGQYEIVLTVRSSTGSTATKKVNVTAKIGVVKTVTGFDSSTDIITYSDGTTEKGTAVFAGGKWTIKNSSGVLVG